MSRSRLRMRAGRGQALGVVATIAMLWMVSQKTGVWREGGGVVLVVGVSYWALTSWRAWERRRRMTQRVGRYRRLECEVCGYDLRGTPYRCPECGAVSRLGWLSAKWRG